MNRLYLPTCAFLFCVSLIFGVMVPCQAQHPMTFSEDFDTSEDYGEMPDGWTAWQNGGGSGGAVWGSAKDYPFSTDWYLISIEEPGVAGKTDEDWLMTPVFTPQEDDFFICDCARGGPADATDIFEFRVSTTTNDARYDFTTVLASYTSAEFAMFRNKVSLDLSAYVGVPIYIAIVHIADVGPDNYSTFMSVDNVQVRPVQDTFVMDAVFRQATTPPRPPVLVNDPIVFAGTVEFRVGGDNGVANISSITLSTAGTTDLSIVKEIIVYFSQWNGVSDDEILAGVYPVFGSVQNPGEMVTITGSQDLELDYEQPQFYFRYILDEDYVATFPYPQIDISVEKLVVNGEELIPSVRTAFGAMDVVGATVPNDNFADAIQLSATPARYGSSTLPATYEEEYDVIAYCHNQGHENIHSVWWYFVAPSDGLVTADLADSHFNSMVAFFDEHMNPVACNDDISSSNQQSKIENYLILKGEKLYVRVSDLGAIGGNQYSISGVVIMDFTFSVLTGLPEDGNNIFISMHPNPTSQNVSLDIHIQRPTDVMIDVRDVMGRSRHAQQEQFTSAGKHTVTMDVSALPPGTYVVSVQQGKRIETRKLSIIK